MRTRLAALAAALLLLSGCGTDTAAPSSAPSSGPSSGLSSSAGSDRSLPDGSWTLVGAEDADGPLTLVPDHPVTLAVSGVDVRGRVCNSYFGSLLDPADGRLLTDLGSTEMACAPPVMELESRYLTALGAITTVESTDETLVLTGSGTRLEYAPTGESAALGLTDQPWVIDTILAGGGPAGTAASTDGGTTVRFTADGRVHFDTSCARYAGTWGEDGALEVRLVATYDATCRGARDQESRALEVLLDSAGWQLDDDRLTLTNPDGAGVGLRTQR